MGNRSVQQSTFTYLLVSGFNRNALLGTTEGTV